ncbi:odorant receptor 131-2-like [Syngnathus typhle]|uniref:odorant receptor 131-2-like n=1 Tax=Syngnathus typhle TaxID=161592 RepID=UPI002A69DCED|nr:odorant receptor 131-2-like [Syngnathus typhle]
MNSSDNASSPQQVALRDSLVSAVVKNLLVVLLWFLLQYINATLFATFFKHQTFHEEPRYILFIHMVINDSAQLSFSVTLFLLSYIVFHIRVSLCCVFILLTVFSTRNTPLNLAAMAAERYVAICRPLRHHQLCTARRTYLTILLIWLVSVAPEVTDLFFTVASQPPGFFLGYVFCVRSNVFPDALMMHKRIAFDCFYFLCVFLTLVFTYIKILRAARSASAQKGLAERARNTVLLHGVQLTMCLLAYVSPGVELLLLLVFPSHMREIRYVGYLLVNILPRFLSPVIYGIRDDKFRRFLNETQRSCFAPVRPRKRPPGGVVSR